MELDPHLAQVHEQLRAAAALGDERTQQVAGALATAATPAVRLAILGALSAAADEITAALLDYPGAPAVTVRLDGEQVSVEVRSTAAPDTSAADEIARPEEGEASARISLRLSESLKSEIDAAAERDGVSVNTWLVRAAAAALRAASTNPFGPDRPFSAGGGTFGPFGPPDWQPGKRSGFGDAHRITGWING
jgi:uncharacterized protein (DUF1778 family)